MPRIFIYDGREFDDPDPDKSVEEVRHYLTHFYGDLRRLTATMEGWKAKSNCSELLQGGLEGQTGQPGSASLVLMVRQRSLRATTSPPAGGPGSPGA